MSSCDSKRNFYRYEGPIWEIPPTTFQSTVHRRRTSAAAIIEAYGSIENAYAHIEEIKPPSMKKSLEENWRLAQLSKELATININCGIEFSHDDAKQSDNLYTIAFAYQYMKRLSLNHSFPVSRYAGREIRRRRAHFQMVTDFEKRSHLCRPQSRGEDWPGTCDRDHELTASALCTGEEAPSFRPPGFGAGGISGEKGKGFVQTDANGHS